MRVKTLSDRRHKKIVRVNTASGANWLRDTIFSNLLLFKLIGFFKSKYHYLVFIFILNIIVFLQLIGYGIGLLEGVDPNPDNFVCAGIIHTKIAQIGVLLRLEPNKAALVGWNQNGYQIQNQNQNLNTNWNRNQNEKSKSNSKSNSKWKIIIKIKAQIKMSIFHRHSEST